MARYGLKRHLKAVMDVPSWMGYRSIKETASVIKQLARDAMGRPPESSAAQDDNFEAAIERLGLDADHLQSRRRAFLMMACLYVIGCIALLAYACYLWAHDGWASSAIAAALSWVIGAFAFREHFWYTQMKHRRLGLTLSDWARLTFVFGDDA